MDPYALARTRIDEAHSADPSATDGRPAELVYADRIESWVVRLVPQASEALRLAARCQHLERWHVPRTSYPMDKAGYHAWRRGLYKRQGDRCRELLLQSGVPVSEADEAYLWVSKTDLRTNQGTQALEDAACLVFLEHELPGFAARHPDYTREKYLDILRKTWRKMSPAAQAAAAGLPLDAALKALVLEAVRPTET
jgi:tRNAThr (cytosine32-N3)-methyltransferase